MTVQETSIEERARSYARTADEAFTDEANFFRSLPADAWSGPTGCAKWTTHDLAGHIVGEAVWFDNLVRGVTDGTPPLPNELWEQLKQLPGDEIADRMSAAGADLLAAAESATPQDLEQTVDLYWAKLPLWRALYIGMQEAVLHNWDGRVGRDPNATIPTPWAKNLATISTDTAAAFANRVNAREV